MVDMIQLLRGTKDILPKEIEIWRYIYNTANKLFTNSNYLEIRTPILEDTFLFQRSIGYNTDIINKEMYSFQDQGKRNITLRPEGTASIARSFIHHKLYNEKNIHRLWYLGPMFRYERPQQGRQRQFHQLGIECIGIDDPIADAEVIRLATKLLNNFNCIHYNLEINCIGNFKERTIYKNQLVQYLTPYKNQLDQESQRRLITNPIRILDSKNIQTQEILKQSPKIKEYLNIESRKKFEKLCQYLDLLKIKYIINDSLVRGLDYYNNTAFEITTNLLGQQNTICGGGRYDKLIEQLGGPSTPAIGWAIGLERLIFLIKEEFYCQKKTSPIYLAIQGEKSKKAIWILINLLEKHDLTFELDLTNTTFSKQLKKAHKQNSKICFIMGDNEANHNSVTIKWLTTGIQRNIKIIELNNYLKYIKNFIKI